MINDNIKGWIIRPRAFETSIEKCRQLKLELYCHFGQKKTKQSAIN